MLEILQNHSTATAQPYSLCLVSFAISLVVDGSCWVQLPYSRLDPVSAGGAVNSSMLTAGHGIQGAGSGGMVMISGEQDTSSLKQKSPINRRLPGIIIGDLVPLRQHGYYLAIVMISYTLGMTTGPIIGGAVVGSSLWRWVR